MRLPVLVPNSGGICEAVDDGVTGVIYSALDHEALAAAMFNSGRTLTYARRWGRQHERLRRGGFPCGTMWTGCSAYTA